MNNINNIIEEFIKKEIEKEISEGDYKIHVERKNGDTIVDVEGSKFAISNGIGVLIVELLKNGFPKEHLLGVFKAGIETYEEKEKNNGK